ncbi:MAG: PEGA domain-containing protein [Myxococcales bacterium]|nr:PEGA domain-containing protein [Myxococcales bacterium]
MRSLATAGLLAWIVIAYASTSSAQEDDARRLFAEGQEAYAAGRYEEAIAAWEGAYERDPRALLLFNLGQAQERLGRLELSLTTFERFAEAAGPEHPQYARATAKIAALRARIESTGLILQGGPEGARFFVDDEARGLLPRPDPLLLVPGQHEVRVEAEGHEVFRSVISIPAGEQISLEVRMEARGASPEASPQQGGVPLVPLSLMIGGGALAAAGGVMGILALSSANAATGAEGGDADSARTFALLSDILIPVGAASAALGLILWMLDDPQPEREGLSLSPQLGPGHAGLILDGRF